MLERARGIEGAIRQPGTHAAGIVICDRPLIDLVPLYKPPEEGAMPATQFTMTEVEELGLLKMDFLGLKTLTLIDRCLKTINARSGRSLTPDDIPLEDEKAYRLLQAGKGLGIFQLESSGMRDLLVSFKPARFSDLVALISLYRPGPMDNIPEFIARKEGRAKIVYDHPDVEPILRETYGLFVYQEQVMQVAQALGGYSLGGADLLRRAMSKKKASEMAKERSKFTKGCTAREIDKTTATRIFDTMEKFASYGFNKSHAAAYAVVAVQTAWLKAHWPVDFYAALITNEIGGDDAKITQYFAEAREAGIRIRPPDINESRLTFDPEADRVRFGLLAIKGVGAAAVEAIAAERARGGPYRSFQDFIARCDKRHLNARAIECLVRCGAFDALGVNRPSLLAALPGLMEMAGSARRDADDPQGSLFDMMNEEQTAGLHADAPIPRLPDWTDKQRFDAERELAGFYLTGHPLERFAPDFAAFSTAPAAELIAFEKGTEVAWVGLIRRVASRVDRNGRMFAFVECEDMTGQMECSFFADVFERRRDLLVEGEVIWVRGRIDTWKDQPKIVINDARAIDEVRTDLIRAIEVCLPWQQVSEASLTRIKEILARHRGRRGFWLLLREGDGELRVEATNGHGIAPTTALVRELQDAGCVSSLRFIARDPRGNGKSVED
jgi:DNA polymerase-3 subunit alpha